MGTQIKPFTNIKEAPTPTRRVVGHTFDLANWEARWSKETQEGKLVEIDNSVCINKQSITSVENSIYDKGLGEITDTDKDVREFSCECGEMTGRFFEGCVCPNCNTRVISRYSMDISRVGWIDIAPFYIINPSAYELIAKVIGGKNLQKILSYDIHIDLDGNLKENGDTVEVLTKRGYQTKQTVPFANSGMIEFRQNFVKIIDYYDSIKGFHEEAKYLIENQSLVFSSKIPVSSVYLRPTYVSSKKRSVSFDKLNQVYIKVLTNVNLLKHTLKKEVELRRSLNIVFDIQQNLQELYQTTIKTKLSGKNKLIRGAVLGNRMNFSARFVIRSYVDADASMDKVEMSYKGFLELNLLEVINVLKRGLVDPSFKFKTVYEVLDYVTKAQYSDEIDPLCWEACQLLLNKREYNSILLLRPPSLALGSLQYFEVNKISPDPKDRTLAVPLSSLPELNGDFDGDCLSVFWLKEKCVIEAFKAGISPSALMLDRGGDSYYNSNFGLIKDEITSLMSLLMMKQKTNKEEVV